MEGCQLSALLTRARLKADARYIVTLLRADALGSTGTEADKYFKSVGLADAFHRQTILAYDINNQTLPIPTARRYGCASNGSSATRWRNM